MAFAEYFQGRREQVGWVKETSYGSGGTMSSGEVVGYNTIIEPDFSQNWQEVFSAGADSLAIASIVIGDLLLPFKLKFTPASWMWMVFVMNSTDGVSSPYTHDFTIRNTVQSFKLEWARRHSSTNLVYTLTGCVVKKASIKFSKSSGTAGEGFVEVELDCVASAISGGTSVTSLSAVSAEPFSYRMAKLTWSGTEVTEVNSGEIIINLGINESDSRYANSTANRALSEPIPLFWKCGGVFNVNIKDSTFFDDWDGAVAVTGTSKLELIRSATDYMKFQFGELYLDKQVAPTKFNETINTNLIWIDRTPGDYESKDLIATY